MVVIHIFWESCLMGFSELCVRVRAEHEELTQPHTKWGLLQESLKKESNGRTCQSSGSVAEQIFWAHDSAVSVRVVLGEWVKKGLWCLGKNTLITDSDGNGSVPSGNTYPCIWSAWDWWFHWSNRQLLCCQPSGELGLGMTYFFQGFHNWARLLCVIIGGSNFCLCNWSHNHIQNFTWSLYRVIKREDLNRRRVWIGRILT